MRPNRLYIYLIILLSTVIISDVSLSHPWGGLVIDKDGNIYFTFICPVVDDNHYACVWQIDTKGNLNEVLKSGRSPSDIVLARTISRSIYGAERSGSDPSFRNTLWAISESNYTEFIGPTTNQNSFHVQALTVSDSGEVYFAIDEKLFLRDNSGEVTQIASQFEFYRIDDLAWSPDGALFILDQNSLIRMSSDGELRRIAENLRMENPPNIPFSGANILFDLTTDDEGNVYLAYFGNRSILKVDSNGNVETILESESNWTPHGIDYYNGELYILESTIGGSWWKFWESNEIVPRVRKIARDGSVETIYSYK